MKLRAYLDNNATTRLADEAVAAMLPYFTDRYLNPSSVAGELFGIPDALSDAQRALARLFGSVDLAGDFVLTSGASEANSWAVHAAMMTRGDRHLVTTAIEHPSLLAAVEARARRGAKVDLVQPDRDGRIRVEQFMAAVQSSTSLVSVIAANNETGVIQPTAEIVAAVRAAAPGALIHVDATQAVGRIALNLADEWNEVDLVSLSAHKFHGPKGIGALFVRNGVRVEPLIYGGKDDCRRGGTPNPAGAAGLTVAANLAWEALSCMNDVRALRDLFEAMILDMVPRASINGMDAPRLPNTSSITLPGLDAIAAVEELACEGICLASGSACSSGSLAPSHVLTAMGIHHDDAKATLRISLSRETRTEEIELAARAVAKLAHMQA